MSQLGPLFLRAINVHGENGGVHENPLDYLTLRYLFVRLCVCLLFTRRITGRYVRLMCHGTRIIGWSRRNDDALSLHAVRWV